jgi:hypothetical protein
MHNSSFYGSDSSRRRPGAGSGLAAAHGPALVPAAAPLPAADIESVTMSVAPAATTARAVHAGFWVRAAAFAIAYVLMSTMQFVAGLLTAAVSPLAGCPFPMLSFPGGERR